MYFILPMCIKTKNPLLGQHREERGWGWEGRGGAENEIFQNDQTHKNREVERGRSVELVSSTPCLPI